MPPVSYDSIKGSRYNYDRTCSTNVWLSFNVITIPRAATETDRSDDLQPLTCIRVTTASLAS